MPIQKQANTGMSTHGVLWIWLDPEMHWHGKPSGKPGRSRTFSDAAVQFCLAIKGLFDLPLRHAMQLTGKLLRLAGLNWPVPDYSTISRRRKKLREVIADITEPPGLHLLVDDSGIQIIGVGDWEIMNRGAHRCQREWIKLPLAVEFKAPAPNQ